MKKLTAEIKLADGTTIEVNDNIVSIEFSELDRTNVSDTTNWGIYSNTGTLSFVDSDSSFFSKYKNLSLYDAKVIIYVTITEENSYKLATLNVDTVDFDEKTNTFTIKLTDTLTKWQDIPLPEIYIFDEASLYYIVTEHILKKVSVKLSITDQARAWLETIKIYCPRIEKGSLWSALTKVCEASMCRISVDRSTGIPTLHRRNTVNNAVIRPYHILSVAERVPNYETRIQNASIVAKSRQKFYSKVVANIPIKLYDIVLADNNQTIGWQFVGNDKKKNEYIKEATQDPKTLSTNTTAKVNIDTIGKSYDVQNVFGVTSVSIKGTVYKRDTNSDRYESYENQTLSLDDVGYSSTYRSARVNFVVKDALTTSAGYVSLPTDLFPNAIAPNIDNNAKITTDVNVEFTGKYFEDGDDVTYYISTPTGLSDNVVSLQSNDLIQASHSENTKGLGEIILDFVQNTYQNGVECAVIECVFGDYYNDDNIPIYTTTKGDFSSFQRYDVVTPYVIKKGLEQPLSLNADRKPKSFLVIGIKYSYDGFLRQKLYLQENV